MRVDSQRRDGLQVQAHLLILDCNCVQQAATQAAIRRRTHTENETFRDGSATERHGQAKGTAPRDPLRLLMMTIMMGLPWSLER